MNLYQILGIDENATPRQIRDALREKAKFAHPDVGGSDDAFIELKLAHDVLTDPQRRARYNETGEIDEPAAADPRGPLYAAAANMVSNILAQGADPRTSCLVDLMRAATDQNTAQLKKQAGELTAMRDRMKETADRFEVDGLDNPLRGAILAFVERVDERLAQNTEALAFDDLMRAFLSGYRYRSEKGVGRYAIPHFAAGPKVFSRTSTF